MSKPDLKVVTLNESNFRDPVKTLRRIADEIEAGSYGNVGSCALVVLGDECSVFGMGPDSDPCSVGMLLHAGFTKMSGFIANHGKG